jgi:hypothetical protein
MAVLPTTSEMVRAASHLDINHGEDVKITNTGIFKTLILSTGYLIPVLPEY